MPQKDKHSVTSVDSKLLNGRNNQTWQANLNYTLYQIKPVMQILSHRKNMNMD